MVTHVGFEEEKRLQPGMCAINQSASRLYVAELNSIDMALR